MTYEEWKERNLRIAERIEQIASRTANMAVVGSAHPRNPDFNALMEEQARLIDRSEKLLDEYERQALKQQRS